MSDSDIAKPYVAGPLSYEPFYIYAVGLSPYEIWMLYTHGHPVRFRLSTWLYYVRWWSFLRGIIRVLRMVGVHVPGETAMRMGCGYY